VQHVIKDFMGEKGRK